MEIQDKGTREPDAVQTTDRRVKESNMDSTEPCVPPGFRFHPTDEELVGYYLKKKVASQKIDLDVIRDIDLYRIEPWDLIDRCRIGYEEQNEWYFFSHKDKKYPTGTRTNRATMAGFWKATGRDKAVHDKKRLIGMRKTLVFYQGRAPNGQKSDWIMHEYRLETEENAPPIPQEEGWVVCRAFKKRTTCQPRSAVDAWDSTYFYEDPNRVISIIDPIEYLQKHDPKSLMCKQESEFDPLNLLQSNQFVELPQLESPSLPIVKHPSLLPMTSKNDQEQVRSCSAAIARVTDWRALDKFVASQFCQEDGFGSELIGSELGLDNDPEMGLLLLGSGREEGSRLMNNYLSTGPECDLEI